MTEEEGLDITKNDIILKQNESGVFVSSLMRDHKTIRRDRAKSIIEDTQTLYKRTVEDILIAISRAQREQNAIIDLSPDTTVSLLPNLKDYDEVKFVKEDLDYSLQIRNLEIQYEVALKRYEYLFGSFKTV
jgi:hypothetical protein